MKSVFTFHGKLPEICLAENWVRFYHEADEVQFHLISPTVLCSYKCLHHFLSLTLYTFPFSFSYSFLLSALLSFLSSVNKSNGHNPGYPVTIVTSRYEHVSVCVLCSKDSPYDTDSVTHSFVSDAGLDSKK